MKRSRAFNRSTSSTSRESKAKKVRVHSQEPLDNQGYPIILLSNLQVHQPTIEYLNSQMDIKRNRIEDKSPTFLSLVKYDPNIHFGRASQKSHIMTNKKKYNESEDIHSDHSWDEYRMDIEEPME